MPFGALEDDAGWKERLEKSILAGPASGNVPPRRDRITAFPAIAEAA